MNYLEIDDCINSKDYNNKNVLYFKFNEEKNINYLQSNLSKKNNDYIINNIEKGEGIIILKQNLKIIGVMNKNEYIHMKKIINKINYIIGMVEITKENIKEEIQLINNKYPKDNYERNNEIIKI